MDCECNSIEVKNGSTVYGKIVFRSSSAGVWNIDGVPVGSGEKLELDTGLFPDGMREIEHEMQLLRFNFANRPVDFSGLEKLQLRWNEAFGTPSQYDFERKTVLLKRFSTSDFDAEYLEMNNGPESVQKTLLLLPKNAVFPVPGIVAPFYHPTAMIGFDPETEEEINNEKWRLGLRLVQHGFAVITSESYHLSMLRSPEFPRSDFKRWQYAADILKCKHPNWSGVGKLVADTRLLVDCLSADPRINSVKIGIMGHSLGGKIAFYTGCLDERIRVIVASDWGVAWHQSNWNDDWYWGKRLPGMISDHLENSQLLVLSHKPCAILAGMYDDDGSNAALENARRFRDNPDSLQLFNHASGHKIPPDALEFAVGFLHRYFEQAPES